jgi:hypothetical protein
LDLVIRHFWIFPTAESFGKIVNIKRRTFMNLIVDLWQSIFEE